MKIEQLQVCIDCDEVYALGGRCPSCASGVAMPLSRMVQPLGSRNEGKRTSVGAVDHACCIDLWGLCSAH